MDKSQLFFVVLIAAFALYFLFGRGGRDRIGGADARGLVEEGAQLIDVRSPGEFGAGHIDTAVNIPVDQLASRLGELSKDGVVIVYCRSGARSSSAARTLRANGFDQVHDLGPMRAW